MAYAQLSTKDDAQKAKSGLVGNTFYVNDQNKSQIMNGNGSLYNNTRTGNAPNYESYATNLTKPDYLYAVPDNYGSTGGGGGSSDSGGSSGSYDSGSSSQAVDYSALYDQFYNEYLSPRKTANQKTYNNIIKNLKNTASDQIDENEIDYRRNARLLKEKMGRLGQTDSGLSSSDFANLLTQRDKTNASIKSQLSSDVAAQEANRNSTLAELQSAASTYAANLISRLKG